MAIWPCAICLEETITNPLTLHCGHSFCLSCLGKHYKQQLSEEEEASCPYCRGEIPNMFDRAVDRLDSYKKRCLSSSMGSSEEKKYAKLALAEFDSANDIFNVDDVSVQLDMLFVRASLTSKVDRPNETIEITKEVLALNEQYPGTLDDKEVGSTKYWQAEAYSACGRWRDSAKIHLSVYKEYVQRGELPDVKFSIGLSRVMYEMGSYDHAIKVGSDAIETCRYHAGVHKYVALAQKALGDIDGARKTISRAILHEEHWDKDNLRENKNILKGLNNL